MGPVIKTYGGYKPKRRRLPMYVVQESLETTGNIFSALHIDNLKRMKKDNCKLKTMKMKKTTEVRDFKPTFDDSLDSTFDKVFKTSEKKANNEVLTDNGTTRHAGNPNACSTCGCVPKINMAYHVLYECKENSLYLDPSPKTLRQIKRKEKQVKETINKNRTKKLTLHKSPARKTLKDTPKKRTPAFKSGLDVSFPVKNSSFQTPRTKDALSHMNSFGVQTSTPEWCAGRPKFSIETSPIFKECIEERVADKDISLHQVENVQSIVQSVNNMSIDVENSCRVPVVCVDVKPQMPSDDFQEEMKIIEDSIQKPHGLTDNLQDEERKSVVVCEDSCSTKHNSDLISRSSIRQSLLQPPNGYITKRRMWRKTRRTAFNLSLDMFASTNKSTNDNHTTDGHESLGTDRSQIVTSKNDKSFHSRKEPTLAQEHFSISCHIREKDSVVKLLKSESNCEKSNAIESNGRKSGKESYVNSDISLNLHELGKELEVGLSLDEHNRKSEWNDCESDSDMFREEFEQNSRNCMSRDGSPLLKEHNSVLSEVLEKHSVQSLQSIQDISSSIGENSLSSDVAEGTDVSVDFVLKPCYVKLYKCDTQTIADVTYTSQDIVTVNEDESMADKSSNESQRNVGYTPDLETTVQLPLSMLGKLDKITVRTSSKISQHSLESIVCEKTMLEGTLGKLMEISTEVKEPAEEEHGIEDINAKNLEDFTEILSRCGQTEPLPFSLCYPESMLPKCKKIGEGAYGEVFLYNGEKQKTVIKVIPVEGDIEINAAAQKKFWEIKPEVIVAQELSSLRGSKSGMNYCDIFNEVLAVRCVRGRYPQWMLDLWHAFDEEQGSENDCPDVFGDDQLFIILELAHGGQDLESFEFTSADQALAAITQIAFALAVGESEIQFEHRDLHWGNVLVASTKAKTSQFTLEGNEYKVPTKGVKVSVIDFTMSRMTMPTTGENMFYDFGHDEELFAAQGDYQCDIYRLMRERTRNNWSVYEPFTNVLWLHYLLDKMCSMVAYRNQNTKLHKQAMGKLENMRDTVLAYPSATAFSSSEFFKSSRVR